MRPRRSSRADRGAGAPRRSPVAALLAALGALALVLTGVVGAEPAAAATSCSGPLAAGQIRVVVVVDPAVSGPSATCLVVPAGTTGGEVLRLRAAQLGMPAPRHAGSGLLCALDGHPAAPECGSRTSGGYRYWAYFNGSGGSWSYGNYNPFIRRLSDGDVEGWRFVDGAGTGQDPPPRIAPSRSLFPALAPAPTAPPPPTAPPAAATGGGQTGGGATPGPGPASGTAAPGTPGDPAAAVPTPGDDGAQAPDGTAGTDAADSPDAGGDGAPEAGEATGAAEATPGGQSEELAAVPASASPSSAGRWVGVAVAVAVALALALGGVARSRARARP